MNVDELVRDALREQAAELAAPGPGFADRVLAVRRRRRTRRLVSVAAATTAVVAVAVGVPLLDTGKEEVRPAAVLDGNGVLAHPDQSPPRDLIAAGRSVLAAYYTAEPAVRSDDRAALTRTYWLLDPETGRYEKDDRWSFVAVAPGARTAAVLERELPARRIGILDLATGRVDRWIPVDRGVGGLAFSRDGGRLVATTYGEHPDLMVRMKAGQKEGLPGRRGPGCPQFSGKSSPAASTGPGRGRRQGRPSEMEAAAGVRRTPGLGPLDFGSDPLLNPAHRDARPWAPGLPALPGRSTGRRARPEPVVVPRSAGLRGGRTGPWRPSVVSRAFSVTVPRPPAGSSPMRPVARCWSGRAAGPCRPRRRRPGRHGRGRDDVRDLADPARAADPRTGPGRARAARAARAVRRRARACWPGGQEVARTVDRHDPGARRGGAGCRARCGSVRADVAEIKGRAHR
ncbi:hypothetical protein SGRIM128S_09294 [Streptomyces griseomycini]